MSKDIELVIRARDAATTAIESIKDALNDLTGVQENVGRSAQKTDTLLGELGRQLSALNNEAKGLAALGKVSGELDKAAGAVGRLEKDVRSSAGEFARLARETDAVAQSAARLRAQLEGERSAIRENTQAQREARKELSEVNRLVREAERNQARYNKAVAATPDVKRGSASRSAATFIEADLSASRARQAQLTADIANYKTNVDRSTAAVKALEPQVAAATRQQNRLASETDKTSNALQRSRNDLQAARGELGQMTTVANAASQSFSGMALNQERVSQASARMAAELARTKARIDGLNQASRAQPRTAPVADTGAIEQQRRHLLELRREWVQSEAEVKRLATAMRTTVEPTEAMGQALGRAQAASRLAKQEYQGQQVALRNLAGSAQSSFATFSQSATRMATANQNFNRVLGTTAPTANAAAAALRPIAPAAQASGSAMAGAAGGANQMRSGLRAVQAEGHRSLAVLQQIRGEVAALTASFFGLYAAFQQIGGVITAFRTVEAAQNRLGAVFNQDTQRVAQELEWLERQAQRLGISFGVLADEYGKFAVAAQAANFTSAATRDIFLSVAEAGRVNKLSMDQMSGVFLALQQMISKGKISAEELRQQLGERLAGAFNIFADALGLTTAELDKMMQNGEVLADQTNLLKFAEELNRRFGPQLAASLEATSTEMGRFSDNVFQAQLRVAEGGFIEAFTEGLRELNEWFASREGRDFFLSLGAALGRFVDVLAKVPDYFGIIQTAISAIIGLKLAGFFTSVIASIRGTQGSLTAAIASFYSWNATVAAATGITGTFGATTTAVRGPVAALAVQLRLAQLGFVMLGARASAAQVALTAVRGVATALVGTFRLLWTAIGGLPGIVLTGITFAIGSWLTSVEDTTEALDEHKRIMAEVISAYEKVADKTKEWGEEIKNVTLDQAIANLRRMRDRMVELREAAADVQFPGSTNALRRRDSGQFALAEQMRDLKLAYDEFEISGRDFVSQMEELYALASDDVVRQYGEQILTVARAAAEGEKDVGAAGLAIDGMGAEVEGMREEIERAGISMDGLSQAVNETGEEMTGGAAKAQIFNDSLAEIRRMIPGLKAELDRLEQINALNKLYQDAANAARTMSELTAITRDYNAAVDGINAKSVENLISGGLVDRITGVESGGKANAKNPNSSATGLGQFIESTWLSMFKKYFPDRAAGMSDAMVLELRRNAEISRRMTELYIQENSRVLREAGVAVNDAALYLAHFLGPQGAVSVLSASANTPVSQLLGQDQISANRSILEGKTAREVYEWAQRKMGVTAQELSIQKEIATEETARVEKINEFNEAFDQRISDAEFELSIASQSNREQEIQRALRESNNEAIAAGVRLTDAQRERIIQTTGALYDQKNARDGLNAAEEKVNQLYQLRQQLLEQQKMAQETGDLEKASALGLRITEINTQLQTAIQSAIAMWQAIGGAEADAAIAKLQTTQMSIQKVGGQMNWLGLNTQQVGQLAASFGDGVVGVFDRFAQALAQGENAVKALGRSFVEFAAAFMREIGEMILKQTILNALQGFLGIPIPGATALAHAGGVVGSVGAGMGNNTRRVSPALFAGALRYHTGGVVGLRPNEIPAILKKNEEVLTESDPRHINNGGGGDARASQPQAIRNILVMDEESALHHLGSSAGERVLMGHIRKNVSTIKRMMG